jgi:hypothetical protein
MSGRYCLELVGDHLRRAKPGNGPPLGLGSRIAMHPFLPNCLTQVLFDLDENAGSLTLTYRQDAAEFGEIVGDRRTFRHGSVPNTAETRYANSDHASLSECNAR